MWPVPQMFVNDIWFSWWIKSCNSRTKCSHISLIFLSKVVESPLLCSYSDGTESIGLGSPLTSMCMPTHTHTQSMKTNTVWRGKPLCFSLYEALLREHHLKPRSLTPHSFPTISLFVPSEKAKTWSSWVKEHPGHGLMCVFGHKSLSSPWLHESFKTLLCSLLLDFKDCRRLNLEFPAFILQFWLKLA